MKTEQVKELRVWFAGYVRGYVSGDTVVRDALDLKAKHTGRVCAEIRALGDELGLRPEELRLAEAMALLHDVGRFEQFVRYGTFADRHSKDHAELGAAILEDQGVLDHLPAAERDIILGAVRYHNRAQLPADASAVCLRFTRLLRDADKLDIWRVVTVYYADSGTQRNAAIELDLPDTAGYTPAIGEDLLGGRVADVAYLQNCNDFKLAQAGWVYDVNYAPTLRHIQARDYLGKIRAALPRDDGIDAMFAVISTYLSERLRNGSRKDRWQPINPTRINHE